MFISVSVLVVIAVLTLLFIRGLVKQADKEKALAKAKAKEALTLCRELIGSLSTHSGFLQADHNVNLDCELLNAIDTADVLESLLEEMR
ncbi:hypothetical protein P8G24_004700 [Salmonella enterica]|nr:hypothetical protein [Salmonella enterica]